MTARVGGVWRQAAANRRPGCCCQTQLIGESGGAARKVPLVAEQQLRSSAGGGDLIRSQFAPSNRHIRSPRGRSGAGPPRCRTTPLCPLSALRKSSLMSAPLLSPWPYGPVSLLCGLLLLASSPLLTAGKMSNCTHPLVPEHGGFRCDPSPCQGFPQKTTIRLFCESGYQMRTPSFSRCRHGKWQPAISACVPLKGNPIPKTEDSMPSMATTAVGVSIFLLTTTACLVLKSRLYPCQSHSRRSSDQLDLMVDGLPVSLPSYEEAVYGSWGQRIPACSAPGPTQLLLAQEAPGCQQSSPSSQSDGSHRPLLSGRSPDNPPPPYEAVQSPNPRDRMSDGDVRQLHVALDKDT